jgi:hypothetical protein
MFNLHITFDMALMALKNAVAAKGHDYVYRGQCVYAKVQNGALVDACIVGNVFQQFGVLRALIYRPDMPPTVRGTWEYDPNDMSNDETGVCNLAGFKVLRKHLEDFFSITMDDEAYTLLDASQEHQDTGMTWGDALHLAVERVFDNRVQTVNDERTAVLNGLKPDEDPLADWERLLNG